MRCLVTLNFNLPQRPVLTAQRRTPFNLEALQGALDAFQESIEHDSDAVPPDFQFHMEVARAAMRTHLANSRERFRNTQRHDAPG